MEGIKLSSPKGIAVYFLTTIFFAVLTWGILLQLYPHKSTFWNYGYNIANGVVYILGGLVGYLFGRCKDANPSLKKSIVFMVGAQVSWGIASLIWAYYNIYLHIEVPFPSVADIFYVGYSLHLFFAIWYLLSGTNTQITRDSVNGSVFIVFCSYLLIIFVYSQVPLAAGTTFTSAFSNFIYPLMETFVLSAAFIAFRLGGPRIKQNISLIFVAALFQLIGDYMFSYAEMTGGYWNGQWSDIAYTISGFVLTFAIVSFGVCQINDKKESN